MPPILDADIYPHLLQSVIAHSPYTTLLTLRRVSHSVKRAADAQLAWHVILHMPDFGPPCSGGEMYLREYDDVFCRERVRSLTVLSAPAGPLPPLPISTPAPQLPLAPSTHPSEPTTAETFATRFPRLHPSPVHPLPGLMSWRDVAAPSADVVRAEHGLRVGMVTNVAVLDSRRRGRKVALERCFAAVRGVRVVDVPGSEAHYLDRGAGYGAQDLLGAMMPHVVRFHSPWGPAWGWQSHASRFIHFVPILKREDEVEWFVPIKTSPTLPPPLRVVVHFTGSQVIPGGIQSLTTTTHVMWTRHEVVLIFTDVEGEREEEGQGRRWLETTARFVYRCCGASFTLVDAAPALFGAQTAPEIIDAIDAAATCNPMEVAKGCSPLEPLTMRIRILSRDDYRREVGTEMYALDMVGLAPTQLRG